MVEGKVTGVRDFGVFVDLGGVEGLVPVSELSHVRVGHPSEVVNVGDEVEVEILRIEAPNPHSPDKAKHKERITLSMRSRQEDPWKAFAAGLKEGDRLSGKVVRLQPFGAFVELKPGVDGLIHISALSDRRIAHPRDVVKVGEAVEVVVEKVDPREKRIGLRLVVERRAGGEHARRSRVRSAAEPAPKAPAREGPPRPQVGPGGGGHRRSHRALRRLRGVPRRPGSGPGERDRDGAGHGPQAALPARAGAEGADPRDRRQREDPALAHRGRARGGAGGDGSLAEDPEAAVAAAPKGFGTLGDLLKNRKP